MGLNSVDRAIPLLRQHLLRYRRDGWPQLQLVGAHKLMQCHAQRLSTLATLATLESAASGGGGSAGSAGSAGAMVPKRRSVLESEHACVRCSLEMLLVIMTEHASDDEAGMAMMAEGEEVGVAAVVLAYLYVVLQCGTSVFVCCTVVWC
jgi:hypothetical protein